MIEFGMIDWTGISAIAERWGWGFVLAVIFLRESWPTISAAVVKYVLPGHAAKEKARIDADRRLLDAKLAAEAEELKSRIQEREWRHARDQHQEETFDKLVEATTQNSQLLAVLNERQGQLIVNHASFASLVLSGMEDMRKEAARLHGQAARNKKTVKGK